MKICFIADANSIHTRRWVEYFCRPENEVAVLSTARNPRPIAGAKVYDLHRNRVITADAGTGGAGGSSPEAWPRALPNGAGGPLRRVATSVYEKEFFYAVLGLYRILRLSGRAGAIVREVKPDLVHCLRLPIEGYIGGIVGYSPLVVSSWGSDLVLFARRYPVFRLLTRKAFKKAAIHITDNRRDRYLAEVYGFSPVKRTVQVPGGGGLKLGELSSRVKDESVRHKLGIAPGVNLLLSPRGFISPYENNRAVLKALPQVLARFPDTLCLFIGDTRSPGYQNLMKLAETLKINERCRFLHRLEHSDFLDYLAASDVMISPSLSDGLPNSMLEAMACGAIPVMSHYCPVQDWITEGWNGYFFDPNNPQDIARALITALDNKGGFGEIRRRNSLIVAERADYDRNMKAIDLLYVSLVAGSTNPLG